MRVALAFVVLLAACGGEPPGEMTNGAAAPAPGEADPRIECRIGAAAAFERLCSVEVAEEGDRRVLTVRKPDGGFRRLVMRGGGQVAAADGAEQPRSTRMSDGRTEVSIGGDVFRLPLAAYRR